MPGPELFLPLLLLCAIAGVHIAYFAHHRANDSQQAVALEPAGAHPTPIAGLRLVLEAEHGAFRGGAAPWRDSPEFARALAQPSPPRRRPRFAEEALRLNATIFEDALVCADDLMLSGDCALLGPVKVCGDLVITGRVLFREPVVVNGYVHVVGEAVFVRGLLSKSDVVVSGAAALGGGALKGWMVARKLRVEGGFALHGSVSTSEGVEIAEAA